MSNYFFDNEEKWYGILDKIVENQISVADDGAVSLKTLPF